MDEGGEQYLDALETEERVGEVAAVIEQGSVARKYSCM